MPAFSYTTLTGPAQGSYKEKGSKFLAFACPVADVAQIRAHLDDLRKTYFDARHHVYAWMLGPDLNQFRASDDGEPNHSAGDPVLGQIRARKLTNVLVVVVRYFGGIKLGVGGLITAYRAAAEDALNNAALVECEVTETITISYDYTTTPDVMRLLKEHTLDVIDQRFEDKCYCTVAVPLRNSARLREVLVTLQYKGITFN